MPKKIEAKVCLKPTWKTKALLFVAPALIRLRLISIDKLADIAVDTMELEVK